MVCSLIRFSLVCLVWCVVVVKVLIMVLMLVLFSVLGMGLLVVNGSVDGVWVV